MKPTLKFFFVFAVLVPAILGLTGCDNLVVATPQANAPAATGNSQDMGQFYLNRARAKSAQKDMAGAFQDSCLAIESNPNLVMAYVFRQGLYVQNGKWDGAIADCTHAIELRPNDAYFYSLRGKVKYKAKDFDGAISDFSMAIQLKPDAYNLDLRGWAYFQKGDVGNASADLHRVMETVTDPNSKGGGLAADSKHRAQGLLCYLAGDYQGAISWWDEPLTIYHDAEIAFWVEQAKSKLNSNR